MHLVHSMLMQPVSGAGRTGRAGLTGVCITLCPRKHEERVPYIERKAGLKFERMGPPQPSEIASIAAERCAASRGAALLM